MKFPGSFLKLFWLPVFILAAAFFPSTFSEIVYDNVETQQSQLDGTPYFAPSQYFGAEFGDELQLAGTARIVTDFYFYYYGKFTPQGDETVKVRFYKNDFALPPLNGYVYIAPGTLIFESDDIHIIPGYGNVHIPNINLQVPDDFTFTVQFTGLTTEGDDAGLLFYYPIQVGSSYNDYWQRDTIGEWHLLRYPDVKTDFAARVVAVTELPPVANLAVAKGTNGLMTISWPAALTNLVLESSLNVASGYSPAPEIPALDGNRNVVTVSTIGPARFFRLKTAAQPPVGVTIARGPGGTLVLSWPVSSTNYVLESSTNVNGPYIQAPEPQVLNGNLNTVTVSITAGTRFFRLSAILPAQVKLTADRGSGQSLILSWPSSASSYILEWSSKPANGYTTVPFPVIPNGDHRSVTVPTTEAAKFFRLKLPN